MAIEPQISIVIPTKNRRDLLIQTLSALREQSADLQAYEIVVVSDGSTDGTAEVVAALAKSPEWSGRTLQCVQQAWGGAAAARNTGLENARGKLVLFVDDDIRAHKDLVSAHLARHAGAAQPEVVVLGRLVPQAGRGALHRQLALWWEGHYKRLAEKSPTFSALYTGNVSVPRDAAIRAGGFDPSIDYGEDIEFGYQLSLLGLPFVYAPEAMGRARNPKSSKGLLRDFCRIGQGCVRIYRKLPGALPELPLSAYGETNLRMRVARGLLLAAAEKRPLEWAIDKGFGAWASSNHGGEKARQMFELARSYYFWRGVRAEVPDKGEWSRLSSHGVSVLTYHSVEPAGTNPHDRYTVSSKRFTLQMALIKLLRYDVRSLQELVDDWRKGHLPPPRSVAITFDDGYTNNKTDAWSILRRFGYPATLFFVTGLAGKSSLWDKGIGKGPKSLLTWDELVELDRNSFRIEAHSVSHPDLEKIGPESLDFELNESRRQLEEKLGRKVELFAYPYGHFNDAAREQAEAAGYKAAFSVRHGLNTLRTDRFALKRVSVAGDDNLITFALKVWTGEDPFRYLPKLKLPAVHKKLTRSS
ncbi:MAG: polysaccharide deacetylase family protein [Chloroflexia bacterium]